MSSILCLAVAHAPTCYEGNTEEERNGTMKRGETQGQGLIEELGGLPSYRHNGKSAGLHTRSRRLQLSKCIIGLSTSSLPLFPFLQITEIGTVISAWHIPLYLNLFARYRRPSWTQWSSICRLSPADFSCLSLSSACLPLPPSPSLFTDRYCSCPTMGIFRCTIFSLPICFG